MSLMNLSGFPERDLFNGDSLPVYMQKLTASRKPQRLSEADSYFAQCLLEQRAWMAEAQRGLLQRVQALQQHADGKRRDRLDQLEIQLYPTKE